MAWPKTKLAILPFLCCGEIVKNSIVTGWSGIMQVGLFSHFGSQQQGCESMNPACLEMVILVQSACLIVVWVKKPIGQQSNDITNALKSLLMYWAKLLKVFTICLETGLKHIKHVPLPGGTLGVLLLMLLYVGNFFLRCVNMYVLPPFCKNVG